MPAYDFSAPRLYVDAPLAAGARLPVERAQANYLLNVLRLGSGGSVLVFNGRDGEWRGPSAGGGGERGGRNAESCRFGGCCGSPFGGVPGGPSNGPAGLFSARRTRRPPIPLRP